MTNKQALREEFQYMQEHYSDPADRKRQEIYIAAEALLDELEAKDKRIAELESERDKQGRHACELFDEVTSQRQQIAELVAAGIITRIED